MFAFVAYAFGVWYAAALHRRRLAAFLWVSAGLLGIVIVAIFHYWLGLYTQGRIQFPLMASLLIPYAALVALVGYFIAGLPRQRVHCRRCNHDLAAETGDPVSVCPSCGLRRSLRAHGHRCAICKYDLQGQDESHGVCPECGTHYYGRKTPPRAEHPAPPPSVPDPSTQGALDPARRRDLLEELQR